MDNGSVLYVRECSTADTDEASRAQGRKKKGRMDGLTIHEEIGQVTNLRKQLHSVIHANLSRSGEEGDQGV